MVENRYFVLLVEDSDDDADLIQRAIRRSQVAVEVYRLSSIPDSLEYLERLKETSEKTIKLLLLDGKIAGSDATEFLVHLDSYQGLVESVVVLTGAIEDRAAEEYRRLGAAEVLRKPVDYIDFVGLIAKVLIKYAPTDN